MFNDEGNTTKWMLCDVKRTENGDQLYYNIYVKVYFSK